MKKLLGVLVLISSTSCATENQLEYMYGRGTPRSSVDFGYGSSQEGSQGPAWSADFLHRAAPRAYFGVGGGIFRSDDNVSGTLVPQSNSTITSKMSTILALGRVDLSWNPKVLTYAIGGIGWVRHSLTITSVPTSPWANTGTLEQRTIVDSSQIAFGYAAGLGLDYMLNDRLFLGAEARYQGSLRKSFPTTPEGAATTGRSSVSAPISIYMFGFKAGVKY